MGAAMTYLASLCRLALFATASLALASACGGTSFSNGDDGEGGESGSATGGSKNTAGTTSTAGKASGGSTGTGGSSSTGGSGPAGGTGSGGSPGGEACNAPAESGTCEAYFERWYHDVTTGLCRPFIYGGCDGNANNYESFEDCQKACPGGSPNYDACQEAADCVVTTTGCCGICDGPEINVRDLIAHNRAFAGQVSTCGADGDVACAPCPVPLPGQGSLKYFVPDCVQGQCAVVDLRTSEYTACETAQDCRLRNGTSCCETCGATSEVVAVRNDGSFEKLVCGSEPMPCLACEPVPPPNAAAACLEGHCSVVYAVPVAE